jgi:aspartate dehydrogenase
LAVIGCGAIGQSLLSKRRELLAAGIRLTTLCVKPSQVASALEMAGEGISVVSDAQALLVRKPDLVIEAAGHTALLDYAEPVLAAKRRFFVISIGALADAQMRARLTKAAEQADSALEIPCGALAGFDGLLALRIGGLDHVRYTSIKPPNAWLGTPGESRLAEMPAKGSLTIFMGSAGQAATKFPKNANLAAAVALAGIGFEKTEVRLVADSLIAENIGRLEARGAQGSLKIEVVGRAEKGNPKSSAIVADSIVSSLCNSQSTLQFV